MPKKFTGENSKAVEARARKAEVKHKQAEEKQKAREDAYWADDDKLIAKKQARKDEEDRKKQDALKRKQELKAAYEEDMAKAATSKAKSAPAPKITQASLLLKREAEKKAREEEERKQLEATKKIEVQPEEIEENINRIDLDAHSARNVDEAIQVLDNSGASPAADKHPEKRLKSAYTAFEENRLPKLKDENPTLRLSQLKQMLRKEWLKAPENPLNQRP
ncbi:hypothetical protein FO519_003945 [Halicephalobus sp. NKZ332]|nr:hypothetical protein FO519_003945 [Halicephalobus sp. NKZ332]